MFRRKKTQHTVLYSTVGKRVLFAPPRVVTSADRNGVAAPCVVEHTRKHILTPEVTVTRQIDAGMRHSAVRERQVPANSAQISIFACDG